jgi:hypothetical protein
MLQVPDDVPQECPFTIKWAEMCVFVQLQPDLDEMAIKSHLIQHHKFKVLNFNLEAANVESSSAPESAALKEALVKARSDGGGTYMPTSDLAVRLLQRRADKDRALGWKIEWVQRQQAITESTSELEVPFVADMYSMSLTCIYCFWSCTPCSAHKSCQVYKLIHLK